MYSSNPGDRFLGKSSLRYHNSLSSFYIISKLDSVKQNSKTIEVFNVQTNEAIHYSSISSAAEALDIPQSSISVYLIRKRTTPFRGIYIFKLV